MNKKGYLTGLVGVVLLALVATSTRAALIWIEGESYTKTNMQGNQWPKGNDPRLLSGGDALAWLSPREKAELPNYAIWEVSIPEDGKYQFYAREFYKGTGSQWRYRFVSKTDIAAGKRPGPEEGWTEADPDAAGLDTVGMGANIAMQWVKYSAIDLKKGDYVMDLQVIATAGKGSSGDYLVNFDCFVLTTEPFIPRGGTKPGAKPAGGDAKGGGASYY